jgi:Rrf2 family transcriptional regulator, nitric oxide-sensitive transcriptional repressor
MQLTRFSDLGLRVLMYLAHHDRADPVTIAEIAAQFQVPTNHLTKVVNKLGHLGWVSTLRGRHGGLRLARAAADIRVGEVVQQMEGHEQLIDCAGLECVLTGRCLLQGALNAALRAFYDELNRHTLADVCATRTGEAIIQLHRQFLSRRDALPPSAH